MKTIKCISCEHGNHIIISTIEKDDCIEMKISHCKVCNEPFKDHRKQ